MHSFNMNAPEGCTKLNLNFEHCYMEPNNMQYVLDVYAIPTARVIFTAKTSLDVFSLRQEHI